MIKKTFLALSISALCACSSTHFRNYEVSTHSEQPVIAGTIAAVVDTDRDYYYEKYLTDELIKKMETRGWKRVPLKQAEYALSVSLGIDTISQTTAFAYESVASAQTQNIVVGKYIDFDLYSPKTKEPKISGRIYINSNEDFLNMINDTLPLIDKELQTKNAYQHHVWMCEYDENENKSNCYMEPVNPQFPMSGREEKTLKTHKTKIIKHPYL